MFDPLTVLLRTRGDGFASSCCSVVRSAAQHRTTVGYAKCAPKYGFERTSSITADP